MKTTIDEIVEQAVIDLDRTSIVPAGYADELRKGINNILTLSKANGVEELDKKQLGEIKKLIEARNRAVRINDPFFTLHVTATSRQISRRLFTAFITPTIGAAVTLGVLTVFENR